MNVYMHVRTCVLIKWWGGYRTAYEALLRRRRPAPGAPTSALSSATFQHALTLASWRSTTSTGKLQYPGCGFSENVCQVNDFRDATGSLSGKIFIVRMVFASSKIFLFCLISYSNSGCISNNKRKFVSRAILKFDYGHDLSRRSGRTEHPGFPTVIVKTSET